MKSRIIQCSPFHTLLNAFVVIIFVQCTVASAKNPSAATPCFGLCNSETDLNTVSTVIVPLNTVQWFHWHRGPLRDILAQCPLSSESHSWPVQLWQTVILSPVQHSSLSFSSMVLRGNPYWVKWAHTWHSAIQYNSCKKQTKKGKTTTIVTYHV